MKRKGILGGIIVVVLVLVLALAVGGGSVSAEEPTIIASGDCGKDGSNVTWALDSTGLLTISGEGEMESYSSVNKNGWITTAPWRNRASTLIIQEGVTSIGNDAFSGCTGLTSVTIPDSVTSIGNYAFWNCTGLTSVTIGNSVSSIGDRAFKDCTGLIEIKYNAKAAANLEYYSTVFDNAGISSGGLRVVIGDGVEHIPACLFYGCTGLTSVTIGNSVTSIGWRAFFGCTGLTGVTIPDSVTSIGKDAFWTCTGLTSVTIGNSVTSIGNYAFENCRSLTEIYYNAKSVADLESYSNVFSNAGKSSDGLRVVIGDGVEHIPAYLFYGCTGPTSVTIGNSVTSIGEDAFSGCTGLTGVTIGNSVTSIGNYAFENCTGLTGVTIGNSVTSIGWKAFSGCTGLASVTIPDSVTSIGNDAFNNCTGLTEIYYNAKAADLGDDCVFSNAGTSSDGLRAVIGNSVEHIPVCLFRGCTGLTSVTIGDSVTSIGNYAFENCRSLTEIYYNAKSVADSGSGYHVFSNAGIPSGGFQAVIGNSVEHIPAYLFSGYTGLTSVTIGNGVTSIGYSAFEDCTGLTSVIIPDSVTSIGYSAFEDCTGVTSVTIGKGVTSIGSRAFYGCYGLTEINYNAKAMEDLNFESGVFDFAGKNTDGIRLIIGKGVKKIPKNLFVNFKECFNLSSVTFTGDPPANGNYRLASTKNKVYAFYPYGNLEWTDEVRSSYGSTFVWSAFSDAPVVSIEYKLGKSVYMQGERLNIQDLEVTISYVDGCVETVPYASGLLEAGEYDFSTLGTKIIDISCREITIPVEVYVHEKKSETLDKAGYPESSHDYENNLDKTYTYTADGALSLDVTFSEQTEVETNIDYLYVNGMKYTGKDLAGKTISIGGDTLTVRLVSDKSDSAYGFSIDSIVKTYMGHEYEDTVVPPTCTEQGYTLRTCPCGSVIKQNYKNALGHDMVTDAAVAPTCTKTGLTEGSHCSRCDDQTTAQEVIPARGHRFNARHICRVCGVEDPVVEITLKKLPTKASYVVNKEALDVAGGVVLAHYESGETEELNLTAAMVSGFDNTVLGKQTLTVTVGGLTTTFEVEVVERAVTSVAVENGKLVKHYTDGTTEETPLKDGAISDFAISETGEKTLTLSSENACVAAYKDADGNYVALKAVANEDGSYSYVVPEEVTEVTVAVKGDLDGDGLINMKDLARLRHDMADGTGEDGLTRLIIDLDGDGIVNMKDMGLLRRYLAGGYDIELGW